MSHRNSQQQMFREAERKSAETNETFLELVNDGMTREELATNIERRPSLWGRFSHWLDKLPSGKTPEEDCEALHPASAPVVALEAF